MKGLLIPVLVAGSIGCASQIFLDGPVDLREQQSTSRIVHVTPLPTACPQPGMGSCYLVTDVPGGAQRLLQVSPGLLDYTPGTDYVVEVSERQLSGVEGFETGWVVDRVVSRHPRVH